MREIKFRMWDKQGNKMYDVDEISLEKRWARMKYYSNYTVSTLSFNDIELMQFTGLHDKNGKEVYEGDIVRAHFKKGAWKYNDKNYYGYKNGKVKYCVDSFILYIENYKEKIYPLSAFGNKEIKDLEVIGNIYDNPELLEVE